MSVISGIFLYLYVQGLWITISGFHKDEKAEIQTLIERMSGMYSPG